MRSFTYLPVGLSLLQAAAAQTSTSCNPTEETCGSDEGLQKSYYNVDFTQGASDDWNVTYGTMTYDDTNGITYTIAKSGDAPTMQTNFYVFFGEVSVEMKTAPGTGIVSCAILESDDLDEVDWEWLGGTSTQVETNYFGKGNTTTYDRETYVTMADSQTEFHNYTIVWTKEALTWKIDGTVVRTLTYAEGMADTGYPQTPMRVKLGTWAGGDSSNAEGTIEWAGGETDYSDGPFLAYVRSVTIVNYNPAESYTYSDLSGSYDSIVLDDAVNTTSTTTTETTSSESEDSSNNSTSSASTSSSSSTLSSSNSSSSSSSASSGASSTAATAGAILWRPNMVGLPVISSIIGLAWILI